MNQYVHPEESDREFDRAAVTRGWRAFIDGQPISGVPVRQLIVESWRRCDRLGVAPRGPCAPRIEDSQFATRRAANRELLAAAEHTWRLLSESLAASDNVFVVADAEGVILEVLGNAEFVAAAARQFCGPGRDWSEAAGGTNAIGTALALERPVMVRSTEHFIEAAKVWDCAASPIRDLTDGSVLGVLDVTSVGDLSDTHTLALAVTAAHQIEYTLHSQDLARSVQLLNWYRAAASPWRGRPTVLLDRKGRVITASEAAEDWLARHPFKVAIEAGVPALERTLPARAVDTLAYQPPADARQPTSGRDWHGGLVVLELSAAASHPAAPTDARPGLHPAFNRIITADTAFIEVMQRAERMARANSPILLQGETGSGKELFAHAIHACSAFAEGPFVAVNCGVLTPELAASELLGYAPGAFTGAALKGRKGKFAEADGGTLFLDEIGELPADVQVHLLRVLQDGVVVPVGGNTQRQVRVRIVAATHRNLESDAAAGRFRNDLLFRLRVLALSLPPLRARRGDIGVLVRQHLIRLQSTYGLGAKTVSDDLLAALEKHAWPGNVRELHGLLESMYILSDRALLTASDLPTEFSAGDAPRAATELPAPARLKQIERERIIDEIARNRHNMSAVARQLGISRSTLYRKLKQHGIGADYSG